MASDSSWSLSLSITARSAGAVTATASVAALLPACRVSIGSEDGAVSAAFLPADEEPAGFDPLSGGCSAQFFEELLFPPPPFHGYTIQPKDFSFTRGFVDTSSSRYALHLFYIRHNYWYDQPGANGDLNEKNLGHTWTEDFNSWHPVDTTQVKVRSGKFDELHVWAPTIVSNGPTFYMFYTGVRSEGGRQHQRIGVATSTDLITWTQGNDPVLTAPQIVWTKKAPPSAYGFAQQLRDPFVMQDPVHSGQWLMYFVALDSLTGRMAVGAATSTNLLNWQPLQNPFRSTQRPTFQGPTNQVESPHVFRRNGQWWMPYTVGGDQVFFETTTSPDPADSAAVWTNPVWLRRVSQGRPAELQFWHASEHLKLASGYEYLAAFDDNATSIDIKGVFAAYADSAAVDSFLLSCPQTLGVADRDGSGDGVRMAVSRLRWGAPEVDLRLELPSRMPVRLAAYDIAGRRRSTLLDRELPGGVTEVTWDGRDDAGRRVASGMYFIRLTYNKGARVSKIVMLR